jgi:hypothetical protein
MGNVAFDSKAERMAFWRSPSIDCEAASSFAIRSSSAFIRFAALIVIILNSNTRRAGEGALDSLRRSPGKLICDARPFPHDQNEAARDEGGDGPQVIDAESSFHVSGRV